MLPAFVHKQVAWLSPLSVLGDAEHSPRTLCAAIKSSQTTAITTSGTTASILGFP